MTRVERVIDEYFNDLRKRGATQFTRKELIDYCIIKLSPNFDDTSPTSVISGVDRRIRESRQLQEIGRVSPGVYVLGLPDGEFIYERDANSLTLDPGMALRTELAQFIDITYDRLATIEARAVGTNGTTEKPLRSVADIALSSTFLVVEGWSATSNDLSQYEGLSL